VGDAAFCQKAVDQTIRELDRLDTLINNAAEQHEIESIEDLDPKEIERTFRTNIFSYFYMTKAAVPHMEDGSTIICTTSVTAYRGSPHLLTYASTKGRLSHLFDPSQVSSSIRGFA